MNDGVALMMAGAWIERSEYFPNLTRLASFYYGYLYNRKLSSTLGGYSHG